MATQLLPRVVLSLQKVLAGPSGQQGIKFDLKDGDITRIHIQGLGRVPVIVAVRLVLVKVESNAQHWELIVAPYESNLLTRLLGRPSGRLDDVSYAVIARLKEVLKTVSVCEPPAGMVIQATLTFTPDGAPKWDWFVSTIEMATRSHNAALRQNELTLARSFGYEWLRRWTGWGLVWVPPKPMDDPWAREHHHEIEQGIEDPLFTVLQSLWRAVFAEGDASHELMANGFAMDKIGTTKLGAAGLREVFKQARDHRLTVITQLG